MEKRNAKMETKSVLAMCYILDEYEMFKVAVEELEKKAGNRDFTYEVLKLSQGKFLMISKHARRFFYEWENTIKTINEHGYISNFMMANFCWGEEKIAEAMYIYEYLQANRDNLDTIKAVLKKLDELKFNDIELNTGLNFSEKKYHVSTNLYHSIHIPYVANAKTVPNYTTSSVEFYSEDTPYEMEITSSLGQISEYGRKIKLNSLVFDPNLIPDSITKETVFDSIINLKKEQKTEVDAIRNAVDLTIGLEDLTMMISSLINTVNTITDEDIKNKLKASIEVMLEELAKLDVIKEGFEEQIVKENPSITEKKLTLEKNLYKQRRTYEALDLC